MLDDKTKNKFGNLCTKITYIFTDFYILKQGYLISTDKDKPFIIQLDSEQIDWFKDLCGDFKILHLWDIRNFKKGLIPPKEKKSTDSESSNTTEKNINDWNNYISPVTSNTEISNVLGILSERIHNTNKCDKWENFTLSDDSDNNEKLILSIFKDNNYVNFKPKDNIDGPDIILTKSLLPLVSEKNYTDLYYASHKVDSELYLIVFDIQLPWFRLYMMHYYIPIK